MKIKFKYLIYLLMTFFIISMNAIYTNTYANNYINDYTDYNSTDYTNYYKNYNNYDYYIKDMNVDVEVNDKREYVITETIDACFNYDKHGIIRSIPYSSSEEKYKIEDIVVYGENYSINKNGNNLELKIGDEDVTIKGDKRYVIKYTLKHFADKNELIDFVYLNVLGDEWDVPIANFTSNIVYPENFNLQNVNVTSGEYGETNNVLANYEVNNNNVIITSKDTIPEYNAITVKMDFDEGAFANVEEFNDGKEIVKKIATVLNVMLLTMTIILIFKSKIENKKITKVIEFYPPENMSSAEMGYIYKDTITTKMITSYIYSWVNKGYLRIDAKTNPKNMTLYKLKDFGDDSEYKNEFNDYNENLLESDSTVNFNDIKSYKIKYSKDVEGFEQELDDFSNYSNLKINYMFNPKDKTIVKMKNSDNKKKKEFSKEDYEKELFDEIFESGSNNSVKESHLTYKLNGAYRNVKKGIKNKYKTDTRYLKTASFLCYENIKYLYIILLFLLMICTSVVGAVDIFETLLFILIFGVVFGSMSCFWVKDIAYDFNEGFFKNIKENIWKIFQYLLWGTVFFNTICCFNSEGMKYFGGYTILDNIEIFSPLFIGYLLTIFISNKKSEYEKEIYGRICGFKEFIEKAEKDRLETLLENDPNYFYEILPYAQALDVTTIWCDKFNGIDVKPSNSHGHSSISGDVVRVSNKLENTMIKSVASKSSSGSSGGSSGGFSGGGSGGGGGSSW